MHCSNDESGGAGCLANFDKDQIIERASAHMSQPCTADARHFFVAEIHGCYRPAWRTFAMAAAMTTAACCGLVGERIPNGTRILSAVAFHGPPALQADGAKRLPTLGAHLPLAFDRIVVVLSRPDRPRRLDWVAASLASRPGVIHDRDNDSGRDGGDDGGHDKSGVDRPARRRIRRALYGAMLQQAARITGECLRTAVATLIADSDFQRHNIVRRGPSMLGVGWQYDMCTPTLVKSVMPCDDGILKRECHHTTSASCATCDAVWANSEDLWPCVHGATRRVALRHAVRRAVAHGVAVTAPVKAIPKAPLTPRRPVVPATTTTTTTTTTTMAPAVVALAKDAHVGAPPDRTGPRCGRALCPSRAGRVNASMCASVRVRCTAGCRVVFHRACWRAVADQTLARGDESPCVTPDCWGLMASVVSLASRRSGGATGRDARTKHVEWQTNTSRGLDEQVWQRSSDPTPTTTCRDRLDGDCIERKPHAPLTDTVNVEIDTEDVATCAIDTADADDHAVAVGDAHEPAETTVLLNVAARTYRKDRQQAEPVLCAKKAKRTRARTQKRQRVRARQKVGLDDMPAPVPWRGDDDRWPSFFVDDAAAPAPTRARSDAERAVRPPTVWRFGAWHPPAPHPS
ncbi:hypothetical protein pdul_cds_419 [Pandoravirus dulcis]|uniref:E3 ubiquitin-protein ligase TTC3/DZIP3 domain-containing protein n=1 Tax=Pandoravirus dulcis TaxID=1349409 RepID=S4VSV8_9VIRU|nr:hypothetical protein pdul_cds_419 [Pandoravirus dulcis]AGO82470.1 hypothetical protein pdul_cds_419 [Pandoravirus dulcis]